MLIVYGIIRVDCIIFIWGMLIRLLRQVACSMYKTKWTHPLPRKDNTTPLQKPFQNWRIIKGDIVMVRTGDDKGKVGKVVKVIRKLNRVVVKGINMQEYTKSKLINIQPTTKRE